jgi:hypothetical protein
MYLFHSKSRKEKFMSAYLRSPLKLSIIFFCIFSVLLISSLHAEEPKQKPPQKQAPIKPPAAQVNLNSIAQAASQRGVIKCANTVNAVTNYLGFNNQAGAILTPDPKLPDAKQTSVVMEIPIQPNNSAIVSATFSPSANSCQASYDAVIYWDGNCNDVIKKQFSNLKFVRKLKENVLQLEGPNINFYIMNAGKGCISFKRETIDQNN